MINVYLKGVIDMKKQSAWEIVRNRFFTVFESIKANKRPSNDKKVLKYSEIGVHTIRAIILPEKENIMTDEFNGYTRTKIKIEEVYNSSLKVGEILEMSEPYYEGYYGGKRCTIVKEHYEPLTIGKVYRLRLGENQVGKVAYRVIECDEDRVCEMSFHKVS